MIDNKQSLEKSYLDAYSDRSLSRHQTNMSPLSLEPIVDQTSVANTILHDESSDEDETRLVKIEKANVIYPNNTTY